MTLRVLDAMKWRVAFGLLAVMPWPWRGWDGSGRPSPEPEARSCGSPASSRSRRFAWRRSRAAGSRRLEVGEGQWVEQDQVLMVFEAPELTARLEQLKAQRDSIQVELDKANKGSRLEEIDAAAAAAERPPGEVEAAHEGLPRRGDQAGQERLPRGRGRRQAGRGRARPGRRPLFRKRMISPSEYDQYQATYRAAQKPGRDARDASGR